MKRRKFLFNTGITTAGTFLAPYILPTGRLFAPTGSRIANHVVLVLFAGGIRNQESVEQKYLQAQGMYHTGNIMPNMLEGAAPVSSQLLYQQWQPVLANPLQAQGTLFSEMRYASGAVTHHNASLAAITGNYNELSSNENNKPTIFEYCRKHSLGTKSAINCWYMGESLNSYTPLNFSSNEMYGEKYGANYLQPLHAFSGSGWAASDLPGIIGDRGDTELMEKFVKNTLAATQNGTIDLPIPSGINPANEMNNDLHNIAYSWRVLNELVPELMVIETSGTDVCHSNFTSYLQSIHKTDYGGGWLWNKIQNHPVLANDTIMLCMSTHGRDMQHNNIYDANKLHAYDHRGDDNSRRTFAMMVGPADKVKQNQIIGAIDSPIGETIDIAPTIAHILGFEDEIPSSFLPGRVLTQAFV